jgi:hypothetical protein
LKRPCLGGSCEDAQLTAEQCNVAQVGVHGTPAQAVCACRLAAWSPRKSGPLSHRGTCAGGATRSTEVRKGTGRTSARARSCTRGPMCWRGQHLSYMRLWSDCGSRFGARRSIATMWTLQVLLSSMAGRRACSSDCSRRQGLEQRICTAEPTGSPNLLTQF